MRTEAPKNLYVETTTRCNMCCEMCVLQSDGARIPGQHMEMETFNRLTPLFPALDKAILNGIGEPLLHPQLENMARTVREAMPAHGVVGIQTNGLLITRERADSLSNSGINLVCISMDMIDPHSSLVTHGGEQNDRILDALGHMAAKSEMRAGIEVVLMRDTFRHLPETIRKAAEHGARFAIVSHMLPYTSEQAHQSLFDTITDRSLEFWEEWKHEATAQGLDMSTYFDMLWKFRKSPEELRLSNFMTAKLRQALAQDIPIHLSALMARDDSDAGSILAELRDIESRTRAVAHEFDLELRMASHTATHDRKCDFIEQETMFVDVRGNVSPCYFLWHDYSCHMDGAKKNVHATLYGNVNETLPQEIWNSAEYAAFRAAVKEYNYPYCGNCSVVPCSDVIGELGPFTRDCRGVEIPCGHCNWCMGGLHCLL